MRGPPRPGARIRIADRPCDVLVSAKRQGGKELLVVRFEDTQEDFCLAPEDYPWPFDKPLAGPAANVHWSKCPRRGHTWCHMSTGTELGIITNAIHAVTGAHFIVYRDRGTQEILAMAAAEWFAIDGDGRPCHAP